MFSHHLDDDDLPPEEAPLKQKLHMAPMANTGYEGFGANERVSNPAGVSMKSYYPQSSAQQQQQ